MTTPIDRRMFLRTAGIVTAGATIFTATGCGARTAPSAAEDTAASKAMRFGWWGNDTMNKTTRAALELYHEKNPQVTFTPETAAWDDFWNKMATEIAGRKAVDAFQMSNQMITDYAKRGALLDFEPYVGDLIKLDTWDENLRKYGVIDGKRVGIPISTDAFTVMYNVDFMTKAGITMPAKAWTWDDLAAAAKEAAKAGGSGMWGMSDGSWRYEVLEPWVRGRGRSFFDTTGNRVTLGFDKTDFGDFLDWWDKRREEGSAISPDVATEEMKGAQTSAFVKGLAPLYFTPSSELAGVRALMKAPCQAVPMPDQTNGSKKANFVRPNLFISSWEGTPYPKEAAKFVNFWINDPDAVKVIGASRGVPPSPESAALIAATDPGGQRTPAEYVALIREIGSPMDSLTPKGGRDVYDLLKRTAQEVQFKRASVSQAVDSFFTQASALVSK